MRNSPLPTRPLLDMRVQIALSAEDKRTLFEVAAKRRLTVSDFIRAAIGDAAPELRAA
jgi:hypothetical protein